MRDIKFRVWDNKENNFWGEGRSLSLVSLVSDSLVNDDITTLEQYTGIKDVYGVEIYEGDIIQPVRIYIDFPEIKPTNLGRKIYVESGNYVYGKWIARDVQKRGFGVDGYYFEDEIKLIGNIHENTDFLEVSE